MKKLFSSALLLLTCTALWSQITITKNDMPSARDTVRYSTSNTRLNFDTTGPVMLWDYSALVPTGQGIDSFRSAFSINLAYTFLFALDDYGTRTTNLSNLGLVSFANTYSFFKKSNSYLEVNGFGGEYNNVPIPAPYTVPDKVYQFPLTYGRKDTTPYELQITIPALGSLHQVGTRYNEVDGWGEVITPYTAFFCLRLRSYTKEVDSITISAFGLSIPLPKNTLTYQWLANGEHIPVLEVSGNLIGTRMIPNSIKFRDGVRSIPPQFGIRANFRANKTTCTTLDTISFTNRTRPNIQGSTYAYTITPGSFTFVGGTSASDAAPMVVFNAPGQYTVSLHVESPAGGSTPAIGDTTRVDYITVTAPSGIQDIQAVADIQVYPNPVSDLLTVRSSEMISSVVMISSSGQKVMDKTVESNSVSVDVRQYPEGIYLLDIQTSHGHEVRKVVIQ